jgi:hypothetical protein
MQCSINYFVVRVQHTPKNKNNTTWCIFFVYGVVVLYIAGPRRPPRVKAEDEGQHWQLAPTSHKQNTEYAEEDAEKTLQKASRRRKGNISSNGGRRSTQRHTNAQMRRGYKQVQFKRGPSSSRVRSVENRLPQSPYESHPNSTPDYYPSPYAKPPSQKTKYSQGKHHKSPPKSSEDLSVAVASGLPMLGSILADLGPVDLGRGFGDPHEKQTWRREFDDVQHLSRPHTQSGLASRPRTQSRLALEDQSGLSPLSFGGAVQMRESRTDPRLRRMPSRHAQGVDISGSTSGLSFPVSRGGQHHHIVPLNIRPRQ